MREFPKEHLLNMIREEPQEGYTRLYDVIIRHSRWSIHHRVVFGFDDKYYDVTYSVGATEYQDETPFDNLPDDMIPCDEVKLVTKIVVEFIKV